MAVKAVNCLRMFVDHYVKMADLAERLTRESEDFSRLWADHTVGRNFAMSMPVRHPRVGEIRLTQQILNIPGAEDNVVLIFPPVDAPHGGSRGEARVTSRGGARLTSGERAQRRSVPPQPLSTPRRQT